jgi:preprotein translocase subunit SecD
MGMVLDGEVISAPTVQGPNLADKDFQITGGGTGGFSESQAKDLALKLRYGALPVEFTRSAERQVSPTLGEDSLQAGILAGLIGLLAVAIYLIVYYRALGVVVILGLGVWSALMYGTVCWLSASRGLTLSLSGVVGIVVSLGTTVDSYVVHFERLKDEVRLGKSVRASTEKGFQMAFRTILTADLASLMGAALLWYLTVGAVRGFAFFLGLSVVLDLLVAYCFDRPMVALLARSRFFTEHPIFGVARGLGRSSDDGGGAQTPKAKAGAAS